MHEKRNRMETALATTYSYKLNQNYYYGIIKMYEYF